MKDLEIAKKRSIDKNLSLCIVKKGKILYESNSEGIRALVQAVERLSSSLNEASVADKTVGKAAALLFAYSKIDSVFTFTVSEGALKILRANNIFIDFESSVPNVMNKDKTDVCPFEKMVLNCDDAEKAFSILKSFFKGKT